jgi:multidrug efflux pump subunit AcrB
VSLDLPRMRAIGVGAGEVIDAITQDGRNLPAGSIDSGARRFTVQTSGDYASIDEIRRTVVRAAGGRVVRVADVATVSYGDGEAIHLTRIDGQRGIVVVANQREGQNILAVREAVAAAAAQLEQELPEGITLVRTFDQADNVEHRLSGFVRDFGLAILLVLVTLLPLGVRASLVVMSSIPLSIAMGLTLLFGAGYGINQLSIVGFVIALGLLVDDSVVVIENIARFLRMGKSPREAAVAATRQITLSVLGCTATLILAFVPLLALPGTAGQFIRSLPLAVVLTVAAVRFVEATLARHEEIAWQVANVGEGNPQIFYNQPPPNQRPNVGEVYASLREFHPDSSSALLDAIRTALQAYAGARIRLIEFENGPRWRHPSRFVSSVTTSSRSRRRARWSSPRCRRALACAT